MRCRNTYLLLDENNRSGFEDTNHKILLFISKYIVGTELGSLNHIPTCQQPQDRFKIVR